MPVLQLTGFAPDADPHTPGVITDCNNMIPSIRSGMRGGYSLVGATDALPSDARGGVIATDTANVRVVYAGTQTALFRLTGTTWTDVSRMGGYTGGLESRWRFAQFGDSTYTVNLVDASQTAQASTNFADVSGMPRALVIESVENFLMVANYNDGSSVPDGWYCSALGNPNDWTPSLATQSANGRLTDAPGPITALRRLGSNMVAYKDRGMWLGTYQGPSQFIWGWFHIPGDIGAPSQESVVNIGPAHYFPGYEDFYIFDGSRPVPLNSPVREWFFNQLNSSRRDRIYGVQDRNNTLIYWFYPSSGSDTPDRALVYNYKTNQWGRADRSIEAALEFARGQQTYNEFEAAYASYDVIPETTYQSLLFTAGQYQPAVFDTNHVLGTLSGESTTSSFTTGVVGDDAVVSRLHQVQPRFTVRPTSATMAHSWRMNSGEGYTNGQTLDLADGRFWPLFSARWHRGQFNFTGDVEIVALGAELSSDGGR